MTRKCPGCRRKMKLTHGDTTLPHDKLIPVYNAQFHCPFCINLSIKVRDKMIELHKAEAEIEAMKIAEPLPESMKEQKVD